MWCLYKIHIFPVQEGLFSTSMIIKTLFPGLFCPKIKFSFFDQNHGLTPSKKMSGWQLCKVNVFVQVGSFFNQMIAKHYFNAHFTQKQIGNFQFLIKLGDLSKYKFLQSKRACFLPQRSSNIMTRPIYPKTNRDKISILCPKSWVRVEKMSMWRLFKIDFFFIVYEGLVFNQMIIRHYFQAQYVQKQTNIKFPISDQIHGLTPLKKSSMASI